MLARPIRTILLIASYSALIPLSSSPASDADQRHRHAGSADSIVSGMRRALSDEIRLWYPLCVDTVFGGFSSDIDYRWELKGAQNKMIVTQARHVWSAANAAMFLPQRDMLRSVAAHGVEFLRKSMWDHEYGGFYDLVDRRGIPTHEDGNLVKRAYGNAFAIYGLSRAFHAFGDSSALRLAQNAFRWLEAHSYDPLHGGYFQFMSREGKPFIEGYGQTPPKDQNSSIHLLECLTELYIVWKDPLVRERLNQMLRLIRDTLTTDKGYLTLFFRRDWTPVTSRDSSAGARERNYEIDHVSFGHDIETAYLMLEASEALGIKRDTVTLRAAKKIRLRCGTRRAVRRGIPWPG
jgi:mannose/cellobiose epimerase-like protein (N-acyl-D-glucosamine 2-epimerase family)